MFRLKMFRVQSRSLYGQAQLDRAMTALRKVYAKAAEEVTNNRWAKHRYSTKDVLAQGWSDGPRFQCIDTCVQTRGLRCTGSSSLPGEWFSSPFPSPLHYTGGSSTIYSATCMLLRRSSSGSNLPLLVCLAALHPI